MPIIDMTQAKELEPIPAGEYGAVMESWECKQSKSSNQPYIGFKFVINEGEHEGRILFRNHSLQTKALFAFKRTIIRLGCDPETAGSASFDYEDELPKLVGAECKLKVTQREYKEDEDSPVRMVNDVQEVLSAYDFASSSSAVVSGRK